MLLHFGVIPYLIFDGDFLPSKAATEVERAKRREESKRKGLEFYRLNKPSQAHLELQKAVDVTPAMARQLIDELKKAGVKYVVAPYEADAQLVYLEKNGILDGILSEDSDLLVFGAKRLLTKLDQYGDCVEINRADFTACREISLAGWSDAEFRRMAILSGCDYLASINKMGLKSAYRFVRKYKTIEKILQMLAFDGHYSIPPGYLEKFHKAELTFLHQRVFCPTKNRIVMMTEINGETQSVNLSFIGADIEQETAIGVAKGDLDPMTKQPIYTKQISKMSPRTPFNSTRKATGNPTSEENVNKSIDSFFKPKRTPLAEISCNTFTPSPTQERLLQRATGATWVSSTAPSGHPDHDTHHDRERPGNESIQTVHHSGTTRSQIVAANGHEILKRRRLCLDDESSPNTKKTSPSKLERSRFFPVPASGPDTLRKKKPRRRCGKDDFTIFSDDSLNDAMTHLPEDPTNSFATGENPPGEAEDQSPGKDEDVAGFEAQRINDKGKDSQSSTTYKDADATVPAIKTKADDMTDLESPLAKRLDRNVTNELRSLAASCAYVPDTSMMRRQRQEIKEGLDSQRQGSSNPIMQRPGIQKQRSMTPLQRLGAGALNRSQSCSGLLGTSKTKESESGEQDLSIKEASSLHHIPSLPTLSTFGPDASALKGSEDYIVPDSEDSTDDSGPGSEDRGKPKIDLGRFAFLG